MTQIQSVLQQGSPAGPGLYLVRRRLGPEFRHFDGERWSTRVWNPWDHSKRDLENLRRGWRSFQSLGWLPAEIVSAPSRAELEAPAGAWRTGKPVKPDVYRVLSELAVGTRDIVVYRVWSGFSWGPAAFDPITAMLNFLQQPTISKIHRAVKWSEMDVGARRTLEAIRFPSNIEDLRHKVRARAPRQGSINELALSYLRQNPGSFANEVGDHLEQVTGRPLVHAAVLHTLYANGLVHREMGHNRNAPSFRYFVAPPNFEGVKGRVVDDILIAPAGGSIVISGSGGKFVLDATAMAYVRAAFAN